MSNKKIKFQILTPQQPVYDSEVEEISVPAKGGRVKVFARHVGMVSLLDSGEVIIKKDGEQIVLHVHKGILEVKPGSIVTILADSADHINELDEEKITAAKERAEKALEDSNNLNEVEFARLQDGLVRELSKLKTFKKYR